MKKVQKGLEAVAKSLQTLAQKVENIQKQVEGLEKKPAKTKTKSAKPKHVKKAPRIKADKQTKSGTAFSIFLKAVEDSNNGISTAELNAKTGFNDKKISNLVYKAKKQGKIKAVGNGVYAKA